MSMSTQFVPKKAILSDTDFSLAEQACQSNANRLWMPRWASLPQYAFLLIDVHLTASHALAGPDRHALTCAGASVCVPDLQELGLLPDKLHCAGVELAGQVHLVGDGEHLSQCISPRAAMPLRGFRLCNASCSPGHCLVHGCTVTCPSLLCRSAQQSG